MAENIEIGAWVDGVPDCTITPQQVEAKLEISDELMQRYTLFRNIFAPRELIVYYPCSGYDASPSQVFSDSRVVYVDKDESAVKLLQKAGQEAYASDALEFNLRDEVDILILLNPQIKPDFPASLTGIGGFVLCNDYHSTARELRQNPEFALKGVVVPSEKGYILDDDNLSDYFKEVETDEEWENARFSFTGEPFSAAKSLVQKITGKSTDIIVEYKRILSQSEILDSSMAIFCFNGYREILESKLPTKKGTADDIYIFQRVLKA